MVSDLETVLKEFITEATEDAVNNIDFEDFAIEAIGSRVDLDQIDYNESNIADLEKRINEIEKCFDPQWQLRMDELESSVKNLVDHINELDVCIKHLLVRIKDLENRKTFIQRIKGKVISISQKLMFWS